MLKNRGKLWGHFLTNPVAITGLVIIAVFGILCLLQPLLMRTVLDGNIYDPHLGYDLEIASHPALPSWKHPLGTDYMGRDIFSRLILATRTSFGVGIIAALVGTAIASLVGISTALYGGVLNNLLMILVDAFIMLPPAVVLLVIGLIFEMNLVQLGLIYGIFAGFGSLALQINLHARAVLNKEFFQAGRIGGGGLWYLVRVHLLPNLASLMVVSMLVIATGSVMIEALLSYLERSFRFSWGSMIWETQENFRGGAVGLQWHVIIPPALAIMLFCSAFYLLARALEEAANPKLASQE
jgi:peptide/nickel transport system permease protein